MTIDLNNIMLVDYREEERFKEIVRLCSGLGEIGTEIYMILNCYSREVYGVIEYTVHNNYNDTNVSFIHINYIEVFEHNRRLGIASHVIKLLNQGYTVAGNSVLESVEFWESLGAEFEEDIHNKEVYNKHLRTGLCVPFIIRR